MTGKKQTDSIENMKIKIGNQDIETLRNTMYSNGFEYRGISGWYDPNGNATGIFHDGKEWFTIWEK